MKYLIALIFLVSITILHAQLPADSLIACYNFDFDASDGINDYDGTLFGAA
jgi:hypothetical protein